MSEGDDPRARFERRATFIAYFLAPVIGYSTAQLYERWANGVALLAGAPLLRIPLGLASLALGCWLGYRLIRFAGERISRILARYRWL